MIMRKNMQTSENGIMQLICHFLVSTALVFVDLSLTVTKSRCAINGNDNFTVNLPRLQIMFLECILQSFSN